jgi:hypothetical protein
MRQRHQKTALFLCTGNYYRSRFAEVLFNFVAGKMGLPWRASSRGLALERGVNNVGPMAVSAVKALEAHQKALRHAYEKAGVSCVPMFVIGNQVLTGLQERRWRRSSGKKRAATTKPPHEAGADGLGHHVSLSAPGTDDAPDLARFPEGQFAHPGVCPWHPGR